MFSSSGKKCIVRSAAGYSTIKSLKFRNLKSTK